MGVYSVIIERWTIFVCVREKSTTTTKTKTTKKMMTKIARKLID